AVCGAIRIRIWQQWPAEKRHRELRSECSLQRRLVRHVQQVSEFDHVGWEADSTRTTDSRPHRPNRRESDWLVSGPAAVRRTAALQFAGIVAARPSARL